MTPAPPKAPWHPASLADRLPALRARAAMAAATRAWFSARGFMEVETPALVPVPGMEVHLHGFDTEFRPHLGRGEATRLWLRTSPELALKRLLVAGAGPVFELARVWRNGEVSPRHAPEFTMLEWYAPGASLADLMDQTEAYVRAMLPAVATHDGVTTDVTRPFERLRMQDAFARWCGIDLLATVSPDGEGDGPALLAAAGAAGHPLPDDLSWEDAFFRLMLDHVEPRIGRDTGTFLTHWPTPQAALARRDPTDPRCALRFEVFVAGIELANAFDELTDPGEQRARFIRDVADRARLHPDAPGWPVDEDFLAALDAGLPPTSGIALGFDRLVMLAAGVPRVADTLWLGGWPFA
ncbi:EF-P lysine aminoacylase EpmA [Humitalea sp. 24SJ18S-53]|uniref:EF-P lysine aminoacylase EpmA n=1 Tax=Humitalea sp. 24SJ18S-53 TaxID=3422307 RepID=UPI003D6797DF